MLAQWEATYGQNHNHLYHVATALISVAGETYIRALTKAHVIAVFNLSARYARTTRYQRSMALRQLLRTLAEEFHAPHLARCIPRLDHPNPRNITVTTAEKDAIMNASPTHLRCWLLMCSDLAIRSGTAAMLTPDHYDAQREELTFTTKYQEKQCLPVTRELADMFARIPRDSDGTTPFVSLLHRLGRVKHVMLRRQFQRVVASVKITRHITPHDLRRTTAVRVHEQSKDLRLVQAILGHKRLESTLYYLDHHNTTIGVSSLELAKLNPITERPQ